MIGRLVAPKSKPSFSILTNRISFADVARSLSKNKMLVFTPLLRREHAAGQAGHAIKAVFHQVFAQLFMAGAGLENNAFGHDDAGPAFWPQVVHYVINEQNFRAGGLHAEFAVRFDAAPRRHKRRIGQNHIKFIVPAVFIGKRVVLVNFGILELVQIILTAKCAPLSGQYHNPQNYSSIFCVRRA